MRTLSLSILLIVGLLVTLWATSGSDDEGAAESPTAPALGADAGDAAEAAAALVQPEESGAVQRAASAAAPEAPPAPQQTSPEEGERSTLSGRVVDERGAPLANAEVHAERQSSDMLVVIGDGSVERALGKTRTGSDGRFRLAIEPSNALRLSVGADGYAPLVERASAYAGQENDLGDLELDRGVILSGRVFDSAGAPVPDVDVFRPRARRGGFQIMGRVAGDVVGTTDAEGRFRLARQAVGPWQLRFHSDRYPDGELEGVTDRPGEVVGNLDVVLDDGFTIEGRVTGVPEVEQGALLVRAREPGQQQGMTIQIGMGAGAPTERERTATIADDGSFRVSGLTRDKDYSLVLRRDTQFTFTARTKSDRVLARAGERGVEIAYDAGAALVFQVVDKRTKAPLEDFGVRAGTHGAHGNTPLTDDSGRALRHHPDGLVRFGNLRPKEGDTAQLEIEAVGYAPFELKGIALVADGDTDLGVLELAPVPVLRVHVTDRATGAPLAGARLTLAPPPVRNDSGRFSMRREISEEGDSISIGGQESHRGETGADGWGSVNSFPGKTCNLTVAADEFAPFKLEGLELPAKGDHEARVEVGRGAIVLVHVVDAGGEPVAGARVEHRDTFGPPSGMLLGGGGTSERTDVHGVARYTHLAPGSHSFRIDEANESGGGLVFFAAGMGGDDAAAGAGWESVTAIDGESHELTLVAPGRGTVSGIIREDGSPLAAAGVSVKEKNPAGRSFGNLLGGGPQESTDSQGRYEIDDLKPGEYTLTVTHSLRAMPYETDLVIAAGPNELDADLPVAIVEGRVFDEHGEGLAGASVRISRREAEGARQGNFMIAIIEPGGDDDAVITNFGGGATSTETDEQGRYQLRGVAAEVDLYVEARADGYEPITSDDFRVGPAELCTGVDVHLDKGGTILVRVAGAEPEGIGLLVRARFVGPSAGDEELAEGEEVEPALSVVSGGEAKLEGLRRGNWEVSLEALGESEEELPEPKTVEVRPDEQSLVEFE